MALVIADRVKETTTTTGTSNLELAGAASGFQSFVSGIGTTNTTYYGLIDANGAWEIGIGTVTDASPDTISRDTVISSSNSDSKVDFSAGTKNVFCTYPASRAPSASMTASTYAFNHSATLSDDQTISNAVLAGPVTVTGTQTITGTVVVV